MSFTTARAWITAHAPPLGPETIDAAIAGGRVLAEDVTAPCDIPPADHAAWDGIALWAQETEGASEYVPAVTPGHAVMAGMTLPPGTDAVVAQSVAAGAILAPVASGSGVLWRGHDVTAGSMPLQTGARLDPAALGLLALIGRDRVVVVRQPRVAMIAPGWMGPMLGALVAREGGRAESLPEGDGAHWARAGRFDAVLLIGSIDTLRDAGGRLEWDGVAIEPGDAAGLGQAGDAPLIRLPVLPVACWAAFDLLAAPLIRGLAGRADPAPQTATLARKISSPIGVTGLVRVTLRQGRATPLGPGLAAMMGADGYVLVPETSEGYEPGVTLSVYP